MVSSLRFREILLFSLVGSSVSNRIHLTARQESQGGGSLGAIPLCVASAEGTLFTETSGVLPTAGCPGVPGAAGGTGVGVAGGAQPTPTISVSSAPAGVSSTSVSLAPTEGVGASLSPSLAAISSTGSPQGSVAAAPLPSFITILAAASGSSETFSQTVFSDLATLTTTETVTTGIVQTEASGGTTTVQVPIVVGPGGIGFIGQTGVLPTDVSIDGNGNTPGGLNNNNPGGSNNNNNPGGNDNNNNNSNDGDDNPSTQSMQQESTTSSSASASASASSTEACILTEVACTQTCTISSISGSSAPTTLCGSPGFCRRQAGGSGCTSTTGTTTSTSFTTASTSASVFICKAG